MCNISLATERFTNSKKRIFSKNSNREPNEAQTILHIPRKEYAPNSTVNTTFISIPQVNSTYEVFLSKPFQTWGAEIGVNEYGVAIGNESVFTNLKLPKKNLGLSGLDLVRLALERSKNAKQALDQITYLLEIYGQDGCGGYQNKNLFYHNSFIIADRTDGFLLETADRFWVAKKIQEFTAISNELTIGSDYEYSSKNLESILLKEKNRNREFSFKKYFSDHFYTYFSFPKIRKQSHEHLANTAKNQNGNYKILDSINILKSHPLPDFEFEVTKSSIKSICLHASGYTTPNQTNGSMVVEWDVSELSQEPLQILHTGTSTPCLSLFKPFYFGTKNFQNAATLSPSQSFAENLWWLHEAISRRANFDYQACLSLLSPSIKPLQDQVLKLSQEQFTLQKKEEVQWKFLKDHVNILKSTLDELIKERIGETFYLNPMFHLYWKTQNKNLGLPGIPI